MPSTLDREEMNLNETKVDKDVRNKVVSNVHVPSRCARAMGSAAVLGSAGGMLL